MLSDSLAVIILPFWKKDFAFFGSSNFSQMMISALACFESYFSRACRFFLSESIFSAKKPFYQKKDRQIRRATCQVLRCRSILSRISHPLSLYSFFKSTNFLLDSPISSPKNISIIYDKKFVNC